MANMLERVAEHNELIDQVYELGRTILDVYPDAENTKVNDAFCNLYSKLVEASIKLCCEANEELEGWYTDDSWHVLHNEYFPGNYSEDNCEDDCERCENN